MGEQIQQRASALGQPKRPSDGPDRGDAARQRTPAKQRVAKRASDEPDRDQDAKSPKPDPEEVPIPTTPPSTPRASPARGAKRRSDSPEQQSSRQRPTRPSLRTSCRCSFGTRRRVPSQQSQASLFFGSPSPSTERAAAHAIVSHLPRSLRTRSTVYRYTMYSIDKLPSRN